MNWSTRLVAKREFVTRIIIDLFTIPSPHTSDTIRVSFAEDGFRIVYLEWFFAGHCPNSGIVES